MARAKNKSAGRAPAAAQPPSTSASAPAALADREGGASVAASSNGGEDLVVVGAASATAGGDQATTVADPALAVADPALAGADQPSPSTAPQGLDLESADQPASTTDVGAAPEDLGDLIAIEGRSRDDRPYRRAGIVWTADWTPHRVTVAQSERLDADDHVLIRYL